MIRFNRFGPTIALSIVAALCLVLSSNASPDERGLCGIHEQLSREQRAEVHGRILELWSEGSTHQEIHDEVAELMTSYGIDLPENRGRFFGNRGGIPGFGHGPDHIMQVLTNEQRAQVREQMIELWSEGAGRDEIHDTVAELLKDYGVEAPERGDLGRGKHGRGHGPGRFTQDLTDEQRAEVFGQMQELRSRGVGREEIHDAIAELLKGHGVEVPEHGGLGRGKHGRGHGPGRFMQDLTTEQRADIRVRMMELWTGGSTHEEIRAAVDELLESYGIDLTENEEGAVSGEKSEGIPADLNLDIEASPNPFEEQTEISYNLPTQTNVSVVVYDLDGQTIRSFDMGHQSAGNHRVVWDGADEIGNRVMNGPYVCRVHAGEFTATSRVMLVR